MSVSAPLQITTQPTTVIRRPPPRQFSNPALQEPPIDVSIRKLELTGALRAGGIDVDVTNVIVSGSVQDSTTGVPQLVVTILDRDWRALNSGVFGQKQPNGLNVGVEIDKVPYNLVEIHVVDTFQLELTFEHRIAALLRLHKSPLKVSRSTTTRAQFIELMLHEIVPEFPELVYVCPEINVVQKVAASRKTGRSLTAKTLGSTNGAKNVKGAGFGLQYLDIRYWDGSIVRLGPSQLHNAATVLDTCSQLGANAKATLACVEACIVEPSTKTGKADPFGNPPVQPGSGGSAGILQFGGGGTALPVWANDVAQSVTHALQDPGATGKGGMMSLALRNPGWSAGQIAGHEQGSAFNLRYDQAQQGAQTVIDAFTRAGGFTATGASGLASAAAPVAQYEFTRGRPGQTEDSYVCAQRLANEVQWRFFIVGRKFVYFVTDDDLLKNAPTYQITPDSVGVAKPTFQAEVGGRTVVRHHHREPKPSEGDMAVRIPRWEAPPGSILSVDGYGPLDDSWIVTQVQRDLFDASGQVHFQAPQKPFKEPAATSTSTGGISVPGTPTLSSSNPIDRVYAAAQAIAAKALPYVYGGGHTGSWASAASARGLDCSSSVSLALYAAGLMTGFSAPIVSGDFAGWGQPGRGAQMTVWYSGGHVFIEFYGRPMKRFDTVRGGSGRLNGPDMRSTPPVETGLSPRHFPGT